MTIYAKNPRKARSKLNARTMARAMTVVLWGIGSAYLVRSEMQSETVDLVTVWATPVVWAVVLSLPIMSTYARRDRQFVATALIWLAALCGSAYTLQATLGRQAESRDVRVERSHRVESERKQLMKELETNKAMLAQAQIKCGTGKRCLQSTQATINVYRSAVIGTETKLAKLPKLTAPNAGEKRIAWIIAKLTGQPIDVVAETVGQLLPSLFGFVLEVSAFGLGMYGFHPKRATVSETVSADNFTPDNGNKKRFPENVIEFRKHPVIETLETVKRPVSNQELADLMGVSKGEASKRWREVSGQLETKRIGRELRIALR